MSSYRVKLSASADQGTPLYLNGASPDVLDRNTAEQLGLELTADRTKASIPLIRRGAHDFADEMGEAMINIMENFASATEPFKPIEGQFWYQKTPQRNYLRVCVNPTGSTINSRWSYVDYSSAAPTGNALSVSLSGDVNTSLPTSFTANANNVVGVTLNLPLVAKDVTGSTPTQITSDRTYAYPEITVDSKGRIVRVKALPAPSNQIAWATVDASTVNIDRNLNVANGKVKEGGNDLVPRGTITLWFGSTVPAGWLLCNGQNGTPDLRGMFVVGAGASGFGYNATGGSAALSVSGTTSSAGAHNHDITLAGAGAHDHGGSTNSHTLTVDQIPSHQHATQWGESNNHALPRYGTNGTNRNNIGSRDTDYDNYEYMTSWVGGGQGHSHGISSAGNHTHTGSAASNGAHTHTLTVSGSTLPPYRALYYIMKA